MFRIDKQLVQVAQPADIPLIHIDLPVAAEQEPQSPDEAVAATNLQAAGAAEQNSATIDTAMAAPADAPSAEKQGEQILQAARQEAQQLLQEAEQQLSALHDEAEKQAQAIFAAAREDGYQQGQDELAQARAALAQEQEQAAGQLKALIAELTAAQEQFFTEIEGELIDLALAMAEKIVRTTIEKREPFEEMIKHALKKMRHDSKITIRVSQRQYEDFFQAESASFVLGNEQLVVNISPEAELNQGDLLLESDEEMVNAGVDSQLTRLALFLNSLPASKTEERES